MKWAASVTYWPAAKTNCIVGYGVNQGSSPPGSHSLWRIIIMSSPLKISSRSQGPIPRASLGPNVLSFEEHQLWLTQKRSWIWFISSPTSLSIWSIQLISCIQAGQVWSCPLCSNHREMAAHSPSAEPKYKHCTGPSWCSLQVQQTNESSREGITCRCCSGQRRHAWSRLYLVYIFVLPFGWCANWPLLAVNTRPNQKFEIWNNNYKSKKRLKNSYIMRIIGIKQQNWGSGISNVSFLLDWIT